MASTPQLTSTSYKVTQSSTSNSETAARTNLLSQVTGTNDNNSSPNACYSNVVSFNVTYKTETIEGTTKTYAIVSVTRKSS